MKSYFTHAERSSVEMSGGTLRATLSGESQRQLDACGLCLSPLRAPVVASPSG
jgi:hypothetical protein